MSNNNLKFIQIILAILICIGMILIIGKSLWVPKVVEFKLQQEGLLEYYKGDIYKKV